MVGIKPRPIDYSQKMCDMYPNLGMPKDITFQVTDSCNLCCTYCYQINKGKRVMSFETAKKLIDLLLSREKGFDEYLGKDNNGCILEFIGGEPMLQVDLIDKIIDYFIQRTFELNHPWKDKFRCSITTNGTLHFTPEVQKFIRKHLGHLSYGITVDGDKKLHDSCRVFADGSGSYDIASAAVEDWYKISGTKESKITVSPYNVDYVFEASKHMVEKGYTDISINCVFEEGWKPEHATILYRELKEFADYLLTLEHPENIFYAFFGNENRYTKINDEDDQNWCGGDGKMLSCDPDGKLFPCIRYMESSLGNSVEPICIGDVDNGIGKCVSCQKCLKLLDGVTRTAQSTQKCLDCPISSDCSWCSAYNYQRFGTLKHRSTFHCDMIKAASLANVYYINKLNAKFNDKDKYPITCPKEWAIPIIGEDEYNMLVELSKEE